MYDHSMGIFEDYRDAGQHKAQLEAYKKDPFNGVYVLKWQNFPDAPKGKQWQAFFKINSDRFAAILGENSILPKHACFTIVQGIQRKNLGMRRVSGIQEVVVDLIHPLAINERFEKLRFLRGTNPKSRKDQWEATIHLYTVTIKIILDHEAKVEPVEDGDPCEWTPTAVLHRGRNSYGKEFILMSATLKMTPAERETEVQRVAEKKVEEAQIAAKQKAADELRHKEWMDILDRQRQRLAEQSVPEPSSTTGRSNHEPGRGCGNKWSELWRPRYGQR